MREAVRRPQESDQFLELPGRLVDSGNVGERHTFRSPPVSACPRPSECAKWPPWAADAGSHHSSDHDEQPDEQERRSEADEQLLPERGPRIRVRCVDSHMLLSKQRVQAGVVDE